MHQSVGGVMRIVVILPRRMHFGAERATAIDLCVRDFVKHSAHRASTLVLSVPVDPPFEDVNFKAVSGGRSKAHWSKLFAEAARGEAPDLVVAHQHLESAAEIARRLAPVPVILHRHNIVKSSNWLRRWRHGRMYERFARTIWVSDVARQVFAGNFPRLAARAVTVHNGLDLAGWTPRQERQPVVLCVGRASPAKGILEAAIGVAQALSARPGWRAQFILSGLDGDAPYFEAVRHALAPLGRRAQILADQRHDDVKSAFESAAIAVVPSLFAEPFGRTAIEAFAGGAALIASTAGALGEVTGDAALKLDEVTPAAIAQAVSTLIDTPSRRSGLGAAGLARVRGQFEIGALAGGLDAVYEQVLNPETAARRAAGAPGAASAYGTLGIL